jgi:hypothetical protein
MWLKLHHTTYELKIKALKLGVVRQSQERARERLLRRDSSLKTPAPWRPSAPRWECPRMSSSVHIGPHPGLRMLTAAYGQPGRQGKPENNAGVVSSCPLSIKARFPGSKPPPGPVGRFRAP